MIMLEETDWIGGQLTAQAVPPDEHPWIEQFGATRSYRDYRERVREYYRRNYPLTAPSPGALELESWQWLGIGSLPRAPRGAGGAQRNVGPVRSGGRLSILLKHKAVSADTQGDQVRAVTVKRPRKQVTCCTLSAPFFLDATELGDLLPMTKTEYVTGAESQEQTGEPHAAAEPQPQNMQGITCCFAIDYLPGEDHTIEKPAEYDVLARLCSQANATVAGPPAQPASDRADNPEA